MTDPILIEEELKRSRRMKQYEQYQEYQAHIESMEKSEEEQRTGNMGGKTVKKLPDEMGLGQIFKHSIGDR